MNTAWLQRLNTPLSGRPLRLEGLAWPQVGDLLAAGRDLLVLPVGATEQHGPHLPLNTDTVIAEAVCAYASALTGAPVLPALAYGVSLGHTERWPGTFSLFHETFIAGVRELARWALATGWRRLLFVNAHFGNDASLRVAVDRLRFDFLGQLLVATRNTWALTPQIQASFHKDAADLHANQAETDLMLFLAPETVRMDTVQDDPDRTVGLVFPHPVAHTSTNGVTGYPSRGTAARGERLLRAMGEALAATVEQARTEQPPLAWERTTHLFGPAPLT